MSRTDVLLHPLRLRILAAFLGDRHLTTAQIQDDLDNVAPASLYRHIATLTEAGFLRVVDEEQIRGAVQRTYALNLQTASLTPEHVATMTPDDHRGAFLTVVAELLGAFDRYATREDFDPIADHAAYAMAGLWLTDEEHADVADEIDAVIHRHLTTGPGDGRRRRIIGTIRLPGDPA